MEKFSYFIIGAGISGLKLASHLGSVGSSFKIVESSAQAGGRINTKIQDEFPIELGAARLLSKHKHVLQLVEDLDIEIYEHDTPSASLFWKNKFYQNIDDLSDLLQDKDPLAVLQNFLDDLNITSLENLNQKEFLQWDSILFRDWLSDRGFTNEQCKFYFLGDIDLNLDYITLFEASFCLISNLTDSDGKIFRMKGGMIELVNKLISTNNIEVSYDEKVTKIESVVDGYQIYTSKGVYFAEKVIATASLTSLAKLELPFKIKSKVNSYLDVGFYGKSVKGFIRFNDDFKINSPFNFILSDDPFRMIVHSDNLIEWYLLSLEKNWKEDEIIEKFNDYFGAENIKQLFIHHYDNDFFNGCYWVYKSGCYHKIFELKDTCCLDYNFYSIGEHFSSIPNWIEGSLESANNLINLIHN